MSEDRFVRALGSKRGAVDEARVRAEVAALSELSVWQVDRARGELGRILRPAGIGETPVTVSNRLREHHLHLRIADKMRKYPRGRGGLFAPACADAAFDAVAYAFAALPEAEHLRDMLGQGAPAAGDGDAWATLLRWVAVMPGFDDARTVELLQRELERVPLD